MITKLFGIMDFLTAGAFLLQNSFSRFPESVVIFFAAYLLIKSLFFLIFLDFASIIDLICGIIILISAWAHIPIILSIIVAAYLIQKAVLSIIS